MRQELFVTKSSAIMEPMVTKGERQEITAHIKTRVAITKAKSADERKKIIVAASIADNQRTKAKNTAQKKK